MRTISRQATPVAAASRVPAGSRSRARDDVMLSMPLAYAAFCSDRWSVYCRYAAASVGSAHEGVELVRAALGDLALAWSQALQSRSPAAVAWELLGAWTSAHRTEGVHHLHHVLSRQEADAWLLSYKLGLSPQQAADAMGLDATDVCLLRKQALDKLTAPAVTLDWHMRRASSRRSVSVRSAPVVFGERRRRVLCAGDVSPVGGRG